MSSAVQVEEGEASEWKATGTEGLSNLQQVAAERLRAHRNRRASVAAQQAEQEARSRQYREAVRQTAREDQRRGASMVRDAVMARYKERESYREFLAVEAERAIVQAQAEAEVAARNAHAVAEAQMRLLEELDEINQPEPGPREQALAQFHTEARGELAHALADIVLGARELMAERERGEASPLRPGPVAVVEQAPVQPAVREVSAAGLTVRLFEDMPTSAMRPEEGKRQRGSEPVEAIGYAPAEGEIEDALAALEEEIAFRRAPEFAEPALETVSIPGNLIEFPRELVAPRKARPRLAEGPLGEEGSAAEPQLRIFEVDALQADAEPFGLENAAAPEWQSLKLDAAAPEEAAAPVVAQEELTFVPQTAPLERRLMSAAVDLLLVGMAELGAVAVVAKLSGPALRGLSLPLASGAVVGFFAVVAVLYQVLFFTLAEGTPGMRVARIALCTFGDGNPTRKAMRRRIVSALLAACPLGLGFAWTLMDNDGLGWHDRMSRMYQRAY